MRLVVRAAEGIEASQIYVSLDEGPAMTQTSGRLAALSCAPHELLGSLGEADKGEPVKEVGQRLLASLTEHPAIKHSLRTLLDAPGTCPIYVRLVTPAAAEYPWETLFDPEQRQFLALQRRWPIARIAEFDQSEKEVRHFAPPLRMLAILSAVGVDAAEEWRSLWQAVQRCPIPLVLHVVAGQHSVKDEVNDVGDPRVTCELLSDEQQLRASIKAAGPHLIHWFCHGKGKETQAPTLMLGTPQDHARGVSSIYLDKNSLAGLAPDAWLVILNCCEGASDTEGVRSLAHELVSVGYPAAVGMREPISASDASLFARVFYKALVEQLAAALADPAEVEIELAAVLNEPRQALRDKFVPDFEPSAAAAACREWTYPILYVRPDPLKIRNETNAPTSDQHGRDYLLSKLDALERARLELHTDTPTKVLEAIEEEIAAVRRAIDAT